MRNHKILVIGPIFNTASGPGGVGGKLFTQLQREGYPVIKSSAIRNKAGRFLDIFLTVLGKCRAYDIILLQGFGLLAFVMEDIVGRIASLLNKPIVYTVHGGAFHEFYEQYPNWCRRVLSRMTLINTPSKFLQAFLIHKGHPTEYIPNYIDLSLFPFYKGPRASCKLLWVRAFHDIYHPELAIEMIEILKQKYPEIHLTMVGPDQGLQKKCEAIIVEKGLSEHITITGPIPNHQLSQYFQSHTIYLNTTRYESFGVALIEAGACGIPIISTEVGEIPYIWTNGDNIVFAQRAPHDFADKISELLENPSHCRQLGMQARKNAEQFTWEQVGPYWIQKIQELT